MPEMRMNQDQVGPEFPKLKCPHCGCGSCSLHQKDGKNYYRCMDCEKTYPQMDWEIAALSTDKTED